MNIGSDAALREALVRALAHAPEGVSLARLCKRLQVRMSVLMRTLAWLGDEPIGDCCGPGLVRVEQRGELQVALLIDGRGKVIDGDGHANTTETGPRC